MVNFHPQLNIDKYPIQIDVFLTPFPSSSSASIHVIIHCNYSWTMHDKCDLQFFVVWCQSPFNWIMIYAEAINFQCDFFLFRFDIDWKTLVLHAITGWLSKHFVGGSIVLSSISI